LAGIEGDISRRMVMRNRNMLRKIKKQPVPSSSPLSSLDPSTKSLIQSILSGDKHQVEIEK